MDGTDHLRREAGRDIDIAMLRGPKVLKPALPSQDIALGSGIQNPDRIIGACRAHEPADLHLA